MEHATKSRQHIRVIKAKEADGSTTVVIQAGGMVIEVANYGSGEYKWRIKQSPDCGPGDAFISDAQIAEALQCPEPTDGWWDAKVLGVAMVWAEPVTFAHVILDLTGNA